jgi:hypothetical protein
MSLPLPGLPILLRALAVWLLLMVSESAQGALRNWIASGEADFAARQSGVIVGAVVIFAITWFAYPWLRIRRTGTALAVGLGWAVLTFAFELGVGHALGLSPARIAADYDLARGGLMPAGLVAMALTPLAVNWARRAVASANSGDSR